MARRHEVLNRYLTPAEAATEALVHSGPGPLVIADYADNPGAGSYGDAPGLLSALLEAGVTGACFGPMVDPEAATFLQAQTLGADVTLQLGGKTDPRFGGGPLTVTGTVVLLSDGHYVGDGPMIGGPGRLGADGGAEGGGSRCAGRDKPRPDAGPATVPRVRHRSCRAAGRRAEVAATLPRRLCAHRGTGDRVRQWRALLS